MDVTEFKKFAASMVEYIGQYSETIRDRYERIITFYFV